MIGLTGRQIKLIRILLDERNYVTTARLAYLLSVSERTIRNDLDVIKYYLKQYDISLNRKSSRGIRFEGSNENKTLIKNELINTDVLVFDRDTRVVLCYFILLCSEKTTYDLLADICLVSRQTIINDFIYVEKEIEKHKLELLKVQGVGISIVGDEIVIRDAFIKCIRKISDIYLIEIIKEKTNLKEYESMVVQLIERIERHLSVSFVYKEQLCLQIAYIMLRAKKGYSIENNESTLEVVKKFTQLDNMYNLLDNLNLNIEDKIYLYDLLLKSEMITSNSGVVDDNNSTEKEMSSYLFEQLEKIYPIDKELRSVLLNGLIVHLRAAMYRIDNDISIKNETLEQIKVSIPIIYQFTKKELQHLETVYNIVFDENEISYIAMYIATAFENSYKLDNVISVLLVCSFGVATSSILKTRLEQLVTNCDIIGPVTREEANKYMNQKSVDIIITTHDDNYGITPTVVVNPLLYAEDIERIKQEMFQLTYSKMYNSFIKAYEKKDTGQCVGIKIKDFVDKSSIQIVSKCNQWQEAIRLAAQPLVDSMKIEKRYVDKMIEAVNRFGTYMVLVKETAFIHAGTEDGINENCTSILILNNPILLGDKNPKLVRNFVVLGIKNKKDNSLLNLVYVFEKEDNLEKLRSTDLTVEEVYELSC